MSDLGFYRYKVNLWNDDKGEDEVRFGFVCSGSYGEAASQIEEAYGTELMDMSLGAMEPSCVLTDEEIAEAKEWKF